MRPTCTTVSQLHCKREFVTPYPETSPEPLFSYLVASRSSSVWPTQSEAERPPPSTETPSDGQRRSGRSELVLYNLLCIIQVAASAGGFIVSLFFGYEIMYQLMMLSNYIGSWNQGTGGSSVQGDQ